MDKKKLMILLAALVLAIGMALAARSLVAGAAAPAVKAMIAAPKGPKVLVAQRALPVGTIITADAIAYQDWPKDMVRDAYFVDGAVDMNKLTGTVVRFAVTAGQPLTQGALVAPGDRGFLAAALGAGMRAITIPVSDKSSVAGFVFPGDHVDLMLTQKVNPTSEGDNLPLAVTETILRNLRVLATDQSPDSQTTDGKTVVRTFHTVTLEVTPRIAEKIEVAQTVGTLGLVLRSIADNQSELDHAIASGAIKLPVGATAGDASKALAQMSNKPIEGTTSYSTGGDVSRFARRTMPATKSVVAPVAAGLPRNTAPTVKVVRGNDVSETTVGGN